MDLTDKKTFLSFSSGCNSYVIPINEVVYITESAALTKLKVPSGNVTPIQVFDFNGQPNQLIPLNEIFGVTSRVEESLTLITQLDQREKDHVDWMDSLAQSLQENIPFTKATDPHKCAFGIWYDAYQPDDKELSDILAKFDAPHKKIHSLAESLLSLAEQDGVSRQQAMKQLELERHQTLKGLLQLFGQAKSRLNDLAKPITIIVAKEGLVQFGIEVDSIGDVIEFSAENWMPAIEGGGIDLQCFDGFFQAETELYINFDLQSLTVFLKS